MQKNTLNMATIAPRKTTIPVKIGNTVIGGSEFVVIAGPCSIESHEQFLETANAVKAGGAVMLRGGIWKLRTSSKSFQGLGNEASSFIKEVVKKVGLPLVAEITDPRQIETLDPLVSVYMVGSRNMHNYSLLKELGLQKKPVLIKRGFAAFYEEWVKSADYVIQGGNENVILCERGIRTFENITRNTLDLNSVVYAKAHCQYPIIVDPSHAVGVTHLVQPLAMAAAAAGCDGLILEVHPKPEDALSDGQQALTPKEFNQLMTQLKKVLIAFDRPLAKI